MNYTKLALKLEKYLSDPDCKINLYEDEDDVLDKKVQEYFKTQNVILSNTEVTELMNRCVQIGVI